MTTTYEATRIDRKSSASHWSTFARNNASILLIYFFVLLLAVIALSRAIGEQPPDGIGVVDEGRHDERVLGVQLCAVQVAQQADLGPVRHHLAVDVQHQRGHGVVGVGAAARPKCPQQCLVVEEATPSRHSS